MHASAHLCICACKLRWLPVIPARLVTRTERFLPEASEGASLLFLPSCANACVTACEQPHGWRRILQPFGIWVFPDLSSGSRWCNRSAREWCDCYCGDEGASDSPPLSRIVHPGSMSLGRITWCLLVVEWCRSLSVGHGMVLVSLPLP